MPDRYEVLSSETTLQVVSPTATEEAQLFTARSTRSGSVFSAIIPQELYRAREFVSYTNDVLEGRAVYLDILAAMPEVESVSIVQGVNAANMLSEELVVTVQSASGRQTYQMPGLPFPRDLADTQAKITAQAAVLTQLEGGG